jgi:hypothetical protein
MSEKTEDVLDRLVRVVEVIRADRELSDWFSGLARKSAVSRRNQIYSMQRELSRPGERKDIVEVVGLLADPGIFAAVAEALKSD